MPLPESRKDLEKLVGKDGLAIITAPKGSWRTIHQDADCFLIYVKAFTSYRDASLRQARFSASQTDVNDCIGLAGNFTKWLNEARYYNSLTIEARGARKQELTKWLKVAMARSELFLSAMSKRTGQDLPEFKTAKRARFVDSEDDMDAPIKRRRHGNVLSGR